MTPADPHQEHYARALGRMMRAIAVLALAGTVVALAAGGWRWAGGFLAGTLASYLNFRWLKQIAESLGASSDARPRARGAVFFGLRYLILAAGGYVIVNFSALNITAALAGLFVAVAAVIFEILFELLYART